MEKRNIEIQKGEVFGLYQSLMYLAGKETNQFLRIDSNLTILESTIKELQKVEESLIINGAAEVKENQLLFKDVESANQYNEILAEKLNIALYTFDSIQLEKYELSTFSMKPILKYLV